jgi:hypothetical protein
MLDNYGYKHTLIKCNTAFPLQKWLNERACVLGYTHIACLVVCVHFFLQPVVYKILSTL